MMHSAEDILTPKQKLVYKAIQNYPEAANDDAVLLCAVWYQEGWDETLDLMANLRRVSRPETLSRRRRELFNLGLINYSPKAMKSRTDAFKSERDRASPVPPISDLWAKRYEKAVQTRRNSEQTSLL